MSNHLERKSNELEQTLAMQIQSLKKDSEEWLKVGTVVLAAGLLTYGIIKVSRKKKDNKNEKALLALEEQGLLTKDIEERLRKQNRSSFWPSLRQRLFIVGLALLREKFLDNLLNPQSSNAQSWQRSK